MHYIYCVLLSVHPADVTIQYDMEVIVMIGNKTRLMINKATQQHMTPQDTAQTLYEYAGFRTTKERLEPFAAGKDLRALLTEGLLVNDPSRKRDSQDRNVRNWLRGDKDVEIHRSTAFEIAFLLELNAQDMNALLASLTEEGLRWRDPE